jgi:hypothetical protein
MAAEYTAADIARINRREAVMYARQLAYLRCPAKIKMHVWLSYSVKLSDRTIDGILAENGPKRADKRSYKPEVGQEHYNDEADGNAFIDQAWEASEQLAQAVASYRGVGA